jgi:hypothetical protein
MIDQVSTSEASSAFVFPPLIANEIYLIRVRHPNIGQKIAALWGTVKMQDYLNSIIFDDRGGRHGFPETTASALFKIQEAHKILFPPGKEKDIWDIIINRLD